MPENPQEISKHRDGDQNESAKESKNDDLSLLGLLTPGIAASAAIAGGVCIENKDKQSISPAHLMLPALTLGMEIAKNIAKDPAIRHGFNDLLNMSADNTDTGIKAGKDVLKGIGDAHNQRGQSAGEVFKELSKLGDGQPRGLAKFDPLVAAAMKLRDGELKAEGKLIDGGMKAEKRVEERLSVMLNSAVEGKQTIDKKTIDGLNGAVKLKQDVDRKTLDLGVDALKQKMELDRKAMDLGVDVLKQKMELDRKALDAGVDVAKKVEKQARPVVETGLKVYKKANPVIGLFGKLIDAAVE